MKHKNPFLTLKQAKLFYCQKSKVMLSWKILFLHSNQIKIIKVKKCLKGKYLPVNVMHFDVKRFYFNNWNVTFKVQEGQLNIY